MWAETGRGGVIRAQLEDGYHQRGLRPSSVDVFVPSNVLVVRKVTRLDRMAQEFCLEGSALTSELARRGFDVSRMMSAKDSNSRAVEDVEVWARRGAPAVTRAESAPPVEHAHPNGACCCRRPVTLCRRPRTS